jgi:hypothetical protein
MLLPATAVLALAILIALTRPASLLFTILIVAGTAAALVLLPAAALAVAVLIRIALIA